MLKKLTFLILLGLLGLQLNAQEFQCAVDVWNTGCGHSNGRIYVHILGGVPPYKVQIKNNQTGQIFKDIWTSNSPVEVLNLPAGTYKVWVYDSKPAPDVPNEFILFAAEVKASSSPVISIDAKYNENCGGADGWIQAKAKEGVGPYSFKNLNTQEVNTSGKFSNLKAGTYTIQASDANFCTDVESVLILNHCDSIFSKKLFHKNTCDSVTSLKLDTVKSGKAYGTNTDSFTVVKYIFISKTVFYIYETTCDPFKTGTFFVKKDTSIYGCDSVLTYKKVTYSPNDRRVLYVYTTSCISYKNKVDSLRTQDQNGCAVVYVTSWIYEGPRTRYLPTRDTCIASPDHIDTLKSLMCADDSIYYVTHFNVLPKDTIRIKESWCKPRNPDISYFLNQWGCESVKIISYLVKPLDTVFVTKDTCYKGSKNSYLSVLKTKDGCDSVVLTTLNVLKTEIRRDSAYFCGLKKSSTRRDTLFHNLGCPAIITIFDSLAPPALVRSTVFRYSCDQDSVKQGTYYDTTYFNYGCIQSITTLRLRDGKTTNNLSDTVLINQNLDTIIFVSKTLVNQYNCDSVVNRKWIYDKAEIYWIPEDSTNCGSKPSETILVQKLKTYYGSDSLVKRKLITFESPKLKVDDYSHPTSKWNGSIDLSVSKGTGPWDLYDEQGNEIDFERSNLKGGLYHAIVIDANGCWDSIAVGISDFWVYIQGRTLHVHGGLADDELVNDYYGGEFGILEIIDSRGNILFTRQKINIRMEFDEKFQISNSGVYYAKMSFPNQPGAYLLSKAVIQ